MKKEELTAALKEAGVNDETIGSIDVDKLNGVVNEDTNKVVASKKDSFMEEGRNSFLTEKGFKTVDDFDAFKTKASSSESETLKKFNKLEGEFNTLKSTHDQLNVKVQTNSEIAKLTSTDEGGFKVDPKFSGFVHSEFATARKAAKDSGKELTMEDWGKAYFQTNKHFQTSTSTGTRSRGPVIIDSNDAREKLKERYASRRKK